MINIPSPAYENRKDDIMKISCKQPEAEPLSFLQYGDVFEFHNNIYMLINDNEVLGSSHRSCVNLSKGEMSYICKDVLVIPHYNAELKY